MENKDLMLFTSEMFGNVRILEEKGKFLFCGSDVAKALSYAKPSDAISAHCRHTVKRSIPHPQSALKKIDMLFVPEGDMYRLITHSHLPDAERFESWIFDEVIPSIRKTGGYIMGQETMSDIELLSRAVLVAQKQIKLKDARISELEPLAQAASKLCEPSAGSVSFDTFAKSLYDGYGLKCGRNKVMAKLREEGILQKNNKPYQTYMNRGWFDVVEIPKNGKVYPTTRLTGKGQVAIANMLIEQSAVI